MGLVILGVAIAISTVVAPAHAVATNALNFEGNILGLGSGGNFSDAQIASIIATNEALFLAAGITADIDLIGKINTNTSVGTFEAQPGFAGTFLSFDCNPAGASGSQNDCKTGFTINFDFSALDEQWQVVKVVVKGGGPTVASQVFFIDPAALQEGDLDPFQSASVSDAERVEACGPPTGPSCKGVSNILVFGVATPEPEISRVPEPTTLTLLGLGTIGALVASRRGRK